MSDTNSQFNTEQIEEQEWQLKQMRERVHYDSPCDIPAVGVKLDADKPMFSLIPPAAEKRIAEVLTFCAKKYAPDNWRQVDDAERRYLDATLRHINAYRAGQVFDDESRKMHLAHAAVSLTFIIELIGDESQ